MSGSASQLRQSAATHDRTAPLGEGVAGAPPSLHQRILADVEGRILAGDWPPGHRIPSEHDLAGLYACSRMTVNKVITQLAQAGLVERRRKAGSFVRRPHSQSAVLEIKDIRAEVVALGLPYSYELIGHHRRRSRRSDAVSLDTNRSGPLVEVICRHGAGLRPFCLEERLINVEAVPEAAAATFDEIAPGAWLMMRVPWTAAEHRIRAIAADTAAASHLDLEKGAPCLVVERRTWAADRPVTFVRLTYPAAAHELVARFAPSQG